MIPIKPLSNYNMEDLFLHCELTTRSELGGNNIDFTGAKTYNIGFMKEGLGFGITSINIDITPSMQPVIDITFKDFYGNLAVEFNRNKDFINGIVDNGGVDYLNFSSMFELPYPKFKLTIKGYLGKPVALDLNVKRIDVSYVPTDGSYEIKATFIPNLYGFFSDMPFYFLKSINFLKNSNKNITSNNKEVTLFDIIETGFVLEQKQQVINKSISKTESSLVALSNLSESILDFNFQNDFIDNHDDYGNQITNMNNPLYFNVSLYSKRNTNEKFNFQILKNLPQDKKTKYLQLIVSSLSTNKNNTQKTVYILEDIKKDFSKNLSTAQQLITKSLDACKEYKKEQYVSTNKELLKQITIENVFDLLVRDSSYLMGRILEAGRKGYLLDVDNRKNRKDMVGYYFPLVQDKATNEQIPYANFGPEFIFINEFIAALSKGLAEEERRELNKNTPPTPDNVETQLKKRGTNLELGAQNPYTLTPTSEDINKNILERTGLIAHLFMEDISNESENVVSAIDSELSNINEGLKKLTDLELSEIKAFCETIKKEIDEEGNLVDSNFINNESKRNIIISRLGAHSRIDSNTLTATTIENNTIFYTYPYFSKNTNNFFGNNDIYVLFRDSKYKNNTTVNTSVDDGKNKDIIQRAGKFFNLSPDNDSTKPYDDSDFEFKKITKDNIEELESLAKKNLLIDFDKMQNELKNSSNINLGKIFYTGISSNQIFDSNTDTNGKYFYAKYMDSRRDTGFVWNFAGTSDEAILQRYILLNLCKKIIGQINNNQKEKLVREKEITENFSKSDGFKIIYNQFHNLCNNWKNLVSIEGANNITQHVVNKFCNENNGAANIFYDIPLLTVQGNKNKINIKNAIINVEPLKNSNEQSSVLNVMSNICVKNNFMFLAIPGMADKNSSTDENKIIKEEGTSELFLAHTQSVAPDSVPVFNHFYVLWMPTPENRSKFNDGNPVYLNFNPKDIQFADGVNIFQIDYGSPSNTVFKSITMSTEDSKMTSESAIAINSIADPDNSKKYKNYDCSALSVMEGRSYRITVEMIGNAQIKPTQFFILNSTHIFSGLYQIMKVSHSIRPNDMTTKFEAIKMKYSGNKDFMFIPPITIEDIAPGYINQPQQSNIEIANNNVDITDSGGFPVAESTMSNYVGTITHPSIPIPHRALLDTVSFLDNGINTTPNKGYDILVGSTPKNPRVIPNWYPNYEEGINFEEWRIRVQSPTLDKEVWTSASGRYQITYTTWRDSSQLIKVPLTGNIVNPKNPPFNKDNQDIVADFLLTSRLRRAGLDDSDIEKSYSNINAFDNILKALQEEWESIKLLRIGQYKKTLKDAYDFFVHAYNVYRGN